MIKSITTSVVICSYNQGHILPYTIASLKRQDTTYPYEVIITDDGSSPQNLAICQELVNQNPADDIKLIYQPDVGFRVSAARNNAIRMARGDIVLVIDGDIVPDKNIVQDHTDIHKASGSPIISCGYRRHKFSAEIGLDEQQRDLQREEKEDAFRFRNGITWTSFLGYCTAFAKSEHSFFDEGFEGWGFEDNEFSFRLSQRHGYHLKVIDNTVDHYEDQENRNPNKNLDPRSVFNFVKNGLYFIDKYTGDDDVMQNVLPSIRRFSLQEDRIVKAPYTQFNDISAPSKDLAACRRIVEILSARAPTRLSPL